MPEKFMALKTSTNSLLAVHTNHKDCFSTIIIPTTYVSPPFVAMLDIFNWNLCVFGKVTSVPSLFWVHGAPDSSEHDQEKVKDALSSSGSSAAPLIHT